MGRRICATNLEPVRRCGIPCFERARHKPLPAATTPIHIRARQLTTSLPAEKQAEASGNLELAVKGATSTPPNRKWYDVSADGLLDAAKFVGKFSREITGALTDLGKSLWSDFLLPDVEK